MRILVSADMEGATGVIWPADVRTDAKHFARLGIAGYGFTPLALPPGFDYRAMFHGVDERVPVSALAFGVRVMTRLLTGLTGEA